MNFAFFDLETTGTSPAFDQPLQFAAILTDADFKEIERVNLRCRLAPHVIPSPHALVVTGLRPDQLIDPELPTLFEFAQELTELISRWSPAIWTGFNSIRFDEEMLRQTFYQNLQPEIFATQFNGNIRFDIMTAAFAMWNCHSDLFNWPVDADGTVRFNLDRLAPENGFEEHNAHDALGDVEATIHIARLIVQRAPKLWAELLANRDKDYVKARLEEFAPLELIGRFGAGPPRGIIGCLCGYATQNPNQAYFFDVDVIDPTLLINAPDEELRSALAEGTPAIRFVSVNKVPTLLKPAAVTDEQRRRIRVIADAPEFRERVVAVMAARNKIADNTQPRPIEQQIFNGFYSWSDKSLIKEFQDADWWRRQEIAASFEDLRLRQIGRRLVGFYASDLLSKDERDHYDRWLNERWSASGDSGPGWMTRQKADQAIAELREQPSSDREMLATIEQYIKEHYGV